MKLARIPTKFARTYSSGIGKDLFAIAHPDQIASGAAAQCVDDRSLYELEKREMLELWANRLQAAELAQREGDRPPEAGPLPLLYDI